MQYNSYNNINSLKSLISVRNPTTWFQSVPLGGASHQSFASLSMVTGCAAFSEALVLRCHACQIFLMRSDYLLPYCVYVLPSKKDGNFYVGFTTDLQRRLTEHFHGQSKATAPRRPFKLIHCEYYLWKSDAERRETYLKTAKGRRALRPMLKDSIPHIDQ